MLVTNHVLAGALVGHAVRRPVLAFGVGVLSHLVLDAVPHWGESRPMRQLLHVAVPDGLLGLAAMAVGTAAAPRAHRWSVLAGAAGGAFLDLDKPSNLFFGFSPFPAAVDDFHGRIQHESPHRMPQEVLVGAATGLVLALVSRSARAAEG